jgi:hypothetical protein
MSFSLTFFQTCSGTMGIGSSGNVAIGFFSFITTVVSSGAVTLVTPVRYDSQLDCSTVPCSTRL